MKKPGAKTKGGWLFLSGAILVYVIVLLVNPVLFSRSMGFFVRIFLQILPVFALVFVFSTSRGLESANGFS
jgi:hypothetical protein